MGRLHKWQLYDQFIIDPKDSFQFLFPAPCEIRKACPKISSQFFNFMIRANVSNCLTLCSVQRIPPECRTKMKLPEESAYRYIKWKGFNILLFSGNIKNNNFHVRKKKKEKKKKPKTKTPKTQQKKSPKWLTSFCQNSSSLDVIF